MRRGQAGFDPTDNGEPQSIFDAMAMDYGAPFESTAVSRKKIIEENEKGVKEKLIIVGPDGSTTENSLFTPSSVASGMADGLGTAMDLGQSLEAQFGFNPDNDTSKLGQILPISDEGIAAILENESAIDRENDVMNRMDAINANMTPADIGAFLTPPEGSGKLRFDADGAVSRSHNQAREELIFKGGIDGMMDNQLYQSSGVSGSGDLVERGGLQAESIFEQGAASMNYAGDGVATGSGDLAPRGEERAEGLNATDVQVIAQSASGTEALEELDKDIKTANGDDSLIAAAGQEFMDGISELADYDPQLVKSMFAMAAAMMMGSSFGDAMATGFGVMEEAAMAEEANTKARTDEVVDMLILNAEFINDATFWATLEEFNLSDEQKESIARKWDLSKGISNVKQFKLKQAEVFQKIHDYGKEMTSLFTNKDNVGDVGPKIDTFLTYAGDQLAKQANPAYIFDGRNEDSIRRAIGSYAERYNRYVAMNNEKGNGLLDQLRNGGIEAVWEGERGSYSMTGGTLTSDVTIAPSQETTFLAAKLNLNLTGKNEAEKNQWLGSQRDFWVKNIQGKGVPYDETDDDVVEMGDLNNVAAGEVGYIGWLYQQTKQMDRK